MVFRIFVEKKPGLENEANELRHELQETYKLSVWKGERASAQILLWSSEAKDVVTCTVGDFKSEDSVLPSSIAEARFVRYTLADRKMKKYKRGEQPVLSPDMLDSLVSFDIAPRSVRPVWLTISVPQDAKAGIYASEVVGSFGYRQLQQKI